MIIYLMPFVLFFSARVEDSQSDMDNHNIGCRLEENLENWDLREDYKLLNSFISRDTLEYEVNPRYGMYINAIARIKMDHSNNNKGIVIDVILLFGDPFEDEKFKKYFLLQYEAYVYALVDKYPLKNTYPIDGECEFLIHQKKFRSCG